MSLVTEVVRTPRKRGAQEASPKARLWPRLCFMHLIFSVLGAVAVNTKFFFVWMAASLPLSGVVHLTAAGDDAFLIAHAFLVPLLNWCAVWTGVWALMWLDRRLG